MITFPKSIFHSHKWEFDGWVQDYDSICNIKYSRRRYKCSVCGKTVLIDSRFGGFR